MGNRRRPPLRHAFTLMEVVIVIAILALLAAVATPIYFRYLDKAKPQAAKTQLKMLKQSVDTFKMDTGKLPSSLDELISNPRGLKGWDGPYLSGKKVPPDPWGNDYVFQAKGDGDYEILSYGQDGQAGGSGKNEDISSND